ncbi:MAG TPA: class I mannose-6-phosphate isomerase [Limnochordia bacterium]|nr:class I mannose-6-phosphate isomerase [Limnochordia bacterium]
MKQELYPLTFHPIYKEKIWGGRQLERILGRALPPGPIGESWDVAAHPHGTSVVERGPLAGRTLTELVEDYGEELLGTALNLGKFPLLLKLIDAHDDLSVQVHPDDQYVQRHSGEAFGKTELWYIVHSEPGAWIIWGLKPGVTKAQFTQAVAEGGEAILACLNKVPVQAGEVYPISAGLVHALGAGCLVAEIQQNSDTTYRVYDWDRVDGEGRSRELHIEQALEVIDFSPQARQREYQLARCSRYFRFSALDKPQGVVELSGRFQILTALAGPARVLYRGTVTELAAGQSCLLPAALGRCELEAEGIILTSSPV